MALRQSLQFGISIVLARLLAPSDFGVLAIVSLSVSVCTVIAVSQVA